MTHEFDARIAVHGAETYEEAQELLAEALVCDGLQVVKIEKERPVLGYAVVQRLRFIEVVLNNCGQFNRQALCDYFGISVPQASQDIQQYLSMAPMNAVYNKSRKCYERAHEFTQIF